MGSISTICCWAARRLKDERDWLHAARHVHAGHGTIWRFLAKEKITFKKIVRAAGREQLDPKRLVFIGESVPRSSGRSSA
ncbi:MAG: hypothetical protein ACREDM_17545 [Methylocella sp.]